MYIVYAIYNKENNVFYIGQTQNIRERLQMHNKKTFVRSYTSKFSGNWEVFYKEKFLDRASALKREKQLKSFRGREFIKQNIPA